MGVDQKIILVAVVPDLRAGISGIAPLVAAGPQHLQIHRLIEQVFRDLLVVFRVPLIVGFPAVRAFQLSAEAWILSSQDVGRAFQAEFAVDIQHDAGVCLLQSPQLCQRKNVVTGQNGHA